jgi:hypothetical protein
MLWIMHVMLNSLRILQMTMPKRPRVTKRPLLLLKAMHASLLRMQVLQKKLLLVLLLLLPLLKATLVNPWNLLRLQKKLL